MTTIEIILLELIGLNLISVLALYDILNMKGLLSSN